MFFGPQTASQVEKLQVQKMHFAQQSEQNIDIIDQLKGDSPSRQEQWYINPSRFYSQYELYLME